MNLTLLAENMIQSRGELELQKSELEEIVLQMIHQYSPVILYKSISREIHQSLLLLDLILLAKNLDGEWSIDPIV